MAISRIRQPLLFEYLDHPYGATLYSLNRFVVLLNRGTKGEGQGYAVQLSSHGDERGGGEGGLGLVVLVNIP